MKEYTAFPKAPELLEPQNLLVLSHNRTRIVGGSYFSAE